MRKKRRKSKREKRTKVRMREEEETRKWFWWRRETWVFGSLGPVFGSPLILGTWKWERTSPKVQPCVQGLPGGAWYLSLSRARACSACPRVVVVVLVLVESEP